MPRLTLTLAMFAVLFLSGCSEEREDKLATPEAQITPAADQQGIDVDLANLSDDSQLQGIQFDYRQVFSTLLQDWLHNRRRRRSSF